jgi:predicted AlkP superfamily phosphohydrolase/phosphomutase
MLGIDGLPPASLRRFCGEGILPNVHKLMEASAQLDVVPTLPAVTSPGWLTIASGAHPGTLGVSNILLPVPGEAPDRIRNGFSRLASRGEYLWETLVAEGRPAIVVKYPGSWPPADPGQGLIQVDGAGGYADITCEFEEVPSAAYLCGIAPPATTAEGCCSVPRGYDDHWRIDSAMSSGFINVVARKPLGWHNLPTDLVPAFEVLLQVHPSRQRRRTVLPALAGRRGDTPVLIVSRSKDAAHAVAELKPGQWSAYIREESERGPYFFRLKLTQLDPEAGTLQLYRSEGHRSSGFMIPEGLTDELMSAAGPVAEWTGTFDYMNGLIDLDGQLEIYDQHTTWLERTIEWLAASKPWDGFFVHWHVIEYAHHIAGASLDDSHPLHNVDQERYLEFLRSVYRLLDRLVGTVTEAVSADDGLALVSDHGHDLVHTLFYLNDFLRDHGWLAEQAHDGHQEIDWSRTAAYGLFPGLILLNGSDRWHGGVVSPKDAAGLREEIAAALRGLVDPRTGRPVVTAVLGPDEMAVHGQWGPSAPDLFFTMDRGYEPATRLRSERASLFESTEPGIELTSGHGSFHPFSPAARTLALIRHRDVPAGRRFTQPVHMVDLAPTFAELLELRQPRHCDGRPLNLSQLLPADEGAQS